MVDFYGKTAPLRLSELRGLNSSSLGVSNVSATITANKTDGDSNTLANPRIRVRNREKAKVVIGDKVPNITTTVSPGAAGFASESVSYLDVGLTLNVEPTIYLNNEIAIRIALQVSNLVGSFTTKSGTTAYQIGTREATTMLQLKDGENQVLAGLINNEDRASGSKVPLLGQLPLVGRLFGTQRDGKDKTEIVLSITPHLIRNIQRPTASASEFSAGTETSFRRRPDTAVKVATVLPASPGLRAPVPSASAVPAAPGTAAPVMPTLPAAAPVTSLPPSQPVTITRPAQAQDIVTTTKPAQATQATPLPQPETTPVKEE